MDSFLRAEWNRSSWVESANDPAGGFPLQSLPYCVFVGENAQARPGVGIGSFVLDLHRCAQDGLFGDLPATLQAGLHASTLNALVASGAACHAALRNRLIDLFDKGASEATRKAVSAGLFPRDAATLLKPIDSANFTDFYASIDHATRVGRLFRPEQPLLPNYKYVPIGYHGRASSLIASGIPVRRPRGQRKPNPEEPPVFEPTQFLDYEVEVGMYIAAGNPLGEPIDVLRAGQHIFGISLVNDWSARDLQSWEYQPLGPFLAKSFATSVSPWVVPIAALAPFRVPALVRPPEDPTPLDYLLSAADQHSGAIDLTVEAYLSTPDMRAASLSPHRLSIANLRDLYWTPAQLIAHHTSNGCNLLPGDLLATGTVSGPEIETAGCLLELTSRGAHPVPLPNGENRAALEDGDEVILRGSGRREGFPAVSLGECRAIILPAI